MGNTIREKLDPKKQTVKVTLLGHDGSGKTTILYSLMGYPVEHTITTIGFNIQNYKAVPGLDIEMWDLGGGGLAMKRIWKYYFREAAAIIYVINLSDPYRLDESLEDLQEFVLKDLEEGKPILVFGNKKKSSDISDYEVSAKVTGILEGKYPFLIQKSEAKQNVGVKEGFKWLVSRIKEGKRDIKR